MSVPQRAALVEFDCSACRYVLRAGPDKCGRIVVCPACEARLFVPQPPPAPFDTPSDSPTLPSTPALRV